MIVQQQQASTVGGFSSPVEITLDAPPDLPQGYLAKHRLLSSEPRTIHMSYRGERIATACVPTGVYNPYRGTAARKLAELVLTGVCDVQGKRVADLGCGSGIIGLACIHAGAASVLLTDINPRVAPLRDHPALRPGDRIEIQDLLEREPNEGLDVVLMSTPTNVADDDLPVPPDSLEAALVRPRDWLPRLLGESARCLAPGGLLALWIKISHRGILPYHELIIALARRSFDIATMRVHAHALESDSSDGVHEGPREHSDLVFSIRKHTRLARSGIVSKGVSSG